MDTKDIGDISEAKVLARLKEKNYPVLTPFGDNQKYDLVYEDGENFVKVQVRTGRYVNGCVAFKLYTTGHNCSDGVYSKSHSTNDVDEFMVYSPETEEIYKIPHRKEMAEMRLRVDEPKKNDSSINWARDYKF